MNTIRATTAVIALLAILLASPRAFSETAGAAQHGSGSHGTPHWSYSGEAGPQHWGEMDPQWAACKLGSSQTPIDLPASAPQAASDLQFHYKASPGKVVNNGHTIVFTPSDGGYVAVAGKKYNLLQFHFHTPSEHKVTGKSHRMEGHLVSKSGDGQYAVVGVFYDPGAANQVVDAVFNAASAEVNKETPLSTLVDPAGLLPKSISFYRYTGSLTTPPCAEGLTWSVLDTPVTASEASIKKMDDMYHGNARPIQPLNGRTVTFGK